jgi:hypothetical protein
MMPTRFWSSPVVWITVPILCLSVGVLIAARCALDSFTASACAVVESVPSDDSRYDVTVTTCSGGATTGSVTFVVIKDSYQSGNKNSEYRVLTFNGSSGGVEVHWIGLRRILIEYVCDTTNLGPNPVQDIQIDYQKKFVPTYYSTCGRDGYP